MFFFIVTRGLRRDHRDEGEGLQERVQAAAGLCTQTGNSQARLHILVSDVIGNQARLQILVSDVIGNQVRLNILVCDVIGN